jgi:hypothetical protein
LTEETCHPKITYFAPSPEGYMPVDRAYWDTPLRVSRLVSEPEESLPLTYGHYFQGITDVISRDDCARLVEAASKHLVNDVFPTDINEIRIYAEKHGSDYHPARIGVLRGNTCIAFVMNVAVTERGKTRLENEVAVLKKLERKFGFSCLPRVHFKGEALVRTDGQGSGETRFLMFLADWLEGYHEFHLSIDEKDGVQKIVLWDGNERHPYLTACQARQVYKQVARIMTLYYGLEAFEQIFPWHHGAGDFVVRIEADSVVVKLITARQYAPMIAPGEEVSIYDALLFFLLNLSVRNRLDRLDGVGTLAWADDACVPATMEGFLEGLKIKERQGTNSEGVVDGFLQYAYRLAKEDLSDMFHALVDACDPAAPDIPVIRTYLEQHIATFYGVLQRLNVSDSLNKSNMC